MTDIFTNTREHAVAMDMMNLVRSVNGLVNEAHDEYGRALIRDQQDELRSTAYELADLLLKLGVPPEMKVAAE